MRQTAALSQRVYTDDQDESFNWSVLGIRRSFGMVEEGRAVEMYVVLILCSFVVCFGGSLSHVFGVSQRRAAHLPLALSISDRNRLL